MKSGLLSKRHSWASPNTLYTHTERQPTYELFRASCIYYCEIGDFNEL
ncbi:MAG: hypothetical protein IJ513_03470 [Bacteroidaceae bacterium]|nr:hypothetical protein [Bacteroidaceae bacterium]